MLQILDLFSGIGGFSLGLEKTGGFKTVAFCEVNEKARMVLAKHWPDTPIYNDVKEITNERLKAEGIVPDVITGGFPCQDISVAGKGEGLSGERSGLWFEFARIIREVGPRWVIIENVSILRSRGLLTILQNLSEIGYDAEWHCITASHVGAPHQRDRIWILGYPHGQQINPVLDGSRSKGSSKTTSTRPLHVSHTSGGDNVADTQSSGHGRRGSEECGIPERQFFSEEQEGSKVGGKTKGRHTSCGDTDVADTQSKRVQGYGSGGEQESYTHVDQKVSLCSSEGQGSTFWKVEPNVGRVADGIPGRVDRLKQLGNSVVPQIPQLIGNCILDCNGR
jgi:DNA (cytosine-5)-methyltransferase 1